MTQPAPSMVTAMIAVARLSLKRLVRGKKLRLAAIAFVLVFATAMLVRYTVAVEDPKAGLRILVEWSFFRLLVYLVPFLFTAGAIAEEVENRTLPFLVSRPVSRFALTMGKFLAGAIASVALLSAAMLLFHVGWYVTSPTDLVGELGDTMRMLGAVALLATFYSALCMCMGALLPEAAGIASILYIAAIEMAIGAAPYGFRLISMRYHAGLLAGFEKGGAFPSTVPDIPLAVSGGVIPALTLVFLMVAALVVEKSEFRFGNA